MTQVIEKAVEDQVQLQGIDYIELYVGNPPQAAHYYRTAFGFSPIAYAGLETKVRDRSSYVMRQGNIHLILTGALTGDSPITRHVMRHGDSVKDIAFVVDNVDRAFDRVVGNGAQPVMEPTLIEDEHGMVRKATMATFGDTVHSLVERLDYEGPFLPGFRAVENAPLAPSMELTEIDHVAVGMALGQLDEWVEFYTRVLSFSEMHEEMVMTEHSAMNSKVVSGADCAIKFPIVEPVSTKKKSQIEEYLSYHDGPGAQHIALRTDNIIESVRSLRATGVEFLSTPNAYYEMLEARVGKIDGATLAALNELDILVDRDEWGRLLQIFTKPLQSRPTLFIEVIERQGARGFGGGNIKALFEAVEREQELRGNV
jgi:4-hydroxyphenylpyruvate dioxygenase